MKDMGHSAAGKSLLEKLWDQLDAVIGRLMSDGVPERDTVFPEDSWKEEELYTSQDEWMSYGEDRGQAQGLAFAIATILNPYEPNVPAVKDRAMERWRGEDE